MLRKFFPVSVALFLLLSAAGVVGTKSTVTCTRNYSWLNNKEGKDPCATWAEMRSLCDSASTSDITPLSSVYSSYPYPSSQTANCDCNEEAYDLMASCVYCQGSAYDGKWASVSNWKTNCPSFESSFIFSSAFDDHPDEGVNISSNLSSSVNYYQPNITWDPKKACYTGDDFDACENTVGSYSGDSSSSVKPKATSTSKHSGGSDYDYYHWSDENLKWAWIGLAIACAIPALMSAIALIVCCVRQKNRKKFYAPLAGYYANGGAPPATAYNKSALMTGHYLSQDSSSTVVPPYYSQDSAFTVPLYKS
ncbi:hypothetical protein BKA62DRAFT_687236 [Auriculariales sp. MPI-PUGE-AT-0066]|nr:hypothetical protein BKA62DRAFT_687236 [Auriculariales sp. MPI-PUGE-AT-0066]